MFENDIKVSFNIASEASYIFILSGQKFIKYSKNDQPVFPDRSFFKGQKILENAKIQTWLMIMTRHFPITKEKEGTLINFLSPN